jgi:NTE family protein
MIRGLTSAFKWLFFRLPWPFAVTFALISVVWIFIGFHLPHLLTERILTYLIPQDIPKQQVPIWQAVLHPDPISDLVAVVYALVSLASFVIGFLFAYNVAAYVNRWAFKLSAKQPNNPPVRPIPNEKRTPHSPFSQSDRIGIVLAGGGAKGAYQAGALTAIYEFLDQHHALGNVKAISGTSIGSWNAMFWLAGMVKSPNEDEPGGLEWWWKNLRAQNLLAPRNYWPGRSNAFLSTDPWQRQFDHIFGSEDVKQALFHNEIHFYLTRVNVRSARLECATNNPKPSSRGHGHMSSSPNKVSYDQLNDLKTPDQLLVRLKTAVFTSMDFPPLFPYMKYDEQLYEDGGIIDNLPIRFPVGEQCNLIFVLPLNSDFEQEPNTKSLTARISRVMDVQHGALELHGFKLLNLYNEMAVLRDYTEELKLRIVKECKTTNDGDEHRESRLISAMQRENRPIKIFAACPHKDFVQETINTRDLWNTDGACVAFNVMRKQTLELLHNFDFAGPQHRPRVARIMRSKSCDYLDV